MNRHFGSHDVHCASVLVRYAASPMKEIAGNHTGCTARCSAAMQSVRDRRSQSSLDQLYFVRLMPEFDLHEGYKIRDDTH